MRFQSIHLMVSRGRWRRRSPGRSAGSVAAAALFMAAAGCMGPRASGGAAPSVGAADAVTPVIDVWYGPEQHFGARGNPQRWINVLGRVRTDNGIVASLTFRLNGGPPRRLTVGPDLHRLASQGDFNVEMDRAELRDGRNLVDIAATDGRGRSSARQVVVHYTRGRTWPLPYVIDWTATRAIHDVAEVVDGHWRLGPGGVRTLDPWYDRVIGLGDLTWTDFEISTVVTFHGFRPPTNGPPSYEVAHAALAVRWPGHAADNLQPHRRWFPLGATAEFTLSADLRDCRWRILRGPGPELRSRQEAARAMRLDVPYRMRMQVTQETVPPAAPAARYRVKLWQADAPEPPAWDLETMGQPTDVQAGGALLIAHNTDVTFGRVEVVALTPAVR